MSRGLRIRGPVGPAADRGPRRGARDPRPGIICGMISLPEVPVAARRRRKRRSSFSGAAIVALALVGLLPGRVATAQEPTGSVRIVSPLKRSRVVGRTSIVLGVEPPHGARAERVIVSVDGKPLATLTSPPWTTSWDAGDGAAAHRLEAAAFFSDGTQARDEVETSPFRVDFVENVDLVNLYAVVRDSSGNYVTGLTRDDFRLSENGRPQAIDRFSTDWKALRVAIVLDTSLSMKGERLDAARDAALGFLDLLIPGDQGMVVTFSDTVEVFQDLTSDKQALAAAIRRAQSVGGTALYDAIYRTSVMLERYEGRRVIVLLSDGRDEAASGLEPGSLHTMDEALDRALRDEVMVFSIGFGRHLERELDFYRHESLSAILRRMAETTGGRVLFSARPGQLRKAFDEVAQDLRHQYSLAYVSDDRRRDGTWREIRLTSRRQDLKVTTRRGYFAPSDEAPRIPPARKAGGDGSRRGS